MSKKTILLSIFTLLLSISLFSQSGPHSMSIGTGAGSLSFTMVYSWGHIDGDDGTFFYSASGSSTTLWNLCWFVYDVTNSQHYFMDTGFTSTSHTNFRPVDGTVDTTNLPLRLINTGITYPNSPGLTSDLNIELSQPSPNDSARMTYTWTFHNSGGSPLDVRTIWFVDGDCYFDATPYDDDLVSATDSAFVTGQAAIGMGENDGSGNVDINRGILMDTDTEITSFFGISDSLGSSYYWSSQYNFAGIAPENVFQIDASLANKVQNDADVNYLSDAGSDCGGVLQVDFTLSALGSKTINFYATWGLNQILNGWTPPPPTKVNANWAIYE